MTDLEWAPEEDGMSDMEPVGGYVLSVDDTGYTMGGWRAALHRHPRMKWAPVWEGATWDMMADAKLEGLREMRRRILEDIKVLTSEAERLSGEPRRDPSECVCCGRDGASLLACACCEKPICLSCQEVGDDIKGRWCSPCVSANADGWDPEDHDRHTDDLDRRPGHAFGVDTAKEMP